MVLAKMIEIMICFQKPVVKNDHIDFEIQKSLLVPFYKFQVT